MSEPIKMLALNLTGKCNFSCRYCYAANLDKSNMTEEVALAALDLASPSEKFTLQFTGGEPLLNFPVLRKVVETAEARKLPALLQLQTNASLLTDEMARFLRAHWVGIGVSIDGRPNVNDGLRLKKSGHGSMGAIMQGIDVLRRNRIACGITCVVTEENVEQLSGLVEFAYFLGNVRKIGFDILRGHGRGAALRAPSAEAMHEAMQAVYARRDALTRLTGVHMEISQQESVKNLLRGGCDAFGHCHAMNGAAAFVDVQGKIYACASLVGNKDFYLGNVRSGIVRERVEKIRQKILAEMSFCRRCEDFQLCGGCCFARWHALENKEEYGAECALKRVSIAQVL